VRGNDINRQRAGEVTEAFGARRELDGSGKAAADAVVHLDAECATGKRWTRFGRIDNLFDHENATAGAFPTDIEARRDEQFVAAGAPRAAFVGARHCWRG